MSERMLYVSGNPGQWVKQTGDKSIAPISSSKSSKPMGWKGYGESNGSSYWPVGGGFGSFGTPCDHDKKAWKPVFTADGIRFFGCAKSDIPEPATNDPKQLIINCTGWSSFTSSKGAFVKEAPSCLKSLQNNKFILTPKTKVKTDELLLDWDDGSGPRLQPIFWPTMIAEAKNNGYKDIVCCCMAGHGRTGTALATIAMATGLADNPDDAINLVRTKHCKRAVETFSQIDYLEIVAMVLCKWKSSITVGQNAGHCKSQPSK